MKAPILALATVAALSLGNVARSQAPGGPQTAVQRLQAIRAKNKELIDRQAATLKQLDELKETAQQLKFLGKRS